jgi:hypothetical protein
VKVSQAVTRLTSTAMATITASTRVNALGCLTIAMLLKPLATILDRLRGIRGIGAKYGR